MLAGCLSLVKAYDVSIHVTPLPPFIHSIPCALDFLRNVVRAHVLILAGGTHFDDVRGRRSLRVLGTFAALFVIARIRRTRLVLLGVGVGPLHSRMARAFARIALRSATSVMVRDEESQCLTRSLTGREDVINGSDLAFVCPRRVVPTVGNELCVIPAWPGRPISVRDYGDVVTTLHQAINDLSAENRLDRVKIVVFHLADRAIAHSLARALEESTQVMVVEPVSVDAALEHLQEAHLVMGMRYHGILLSAMAGRPLVAIPYHTKCISLVRQLGIEMVSTPPLFDLQPRDVVVAGRRALFGTQADDERLLRLRATATRAGQEALELAGLSPWR
jgi:polysaccharide pyruvyl transferase WcaK-like protein